MKFLSSREWKLYFIIVGFAAVIAVSITVVILLPGYRAQRRVRKDAVQKNIKQINLLSAYKIPEEYSRLLNERWKHFYIPKEKWKEEDVAKYWVDPKVMALQFLETKNNTLVEEILDKYD